MPSVRRVTAEDWEALRDVRLRALTHSPASFGSNVAREKAFAPRRWRDWALSSPVFVAFADNSPVAMVAGIVGEIPDARQVVALWVSPAHRGAGLADLLVSKVEAWARDEGAARVTLWAADGNNSARRLYERRGYLDCGDYEPMPSNPDVMRRRLVLNLT